MKKTLLVSAIALVSIILWENNYAGSSYKMGAITSEKFPNDTMPKKHKHKDTTSTPTDTAGVTYVKVNRIISAK